MNASDVMVSKVVTVGPKADVQEVAKLLLSHRISAVPVVGDKGELLGIVSEGDLIRRAETGTLKQRSWWLQLFIGNPSLAAEYVKSHSSKVVDVMTRRVITATPETPLGEIATVLEKNRIKRVPIVKNGKIVGIVSRANLLQALASMPKRTVSAEKVLDSEIRKNVIARLSAEPWAPSMFNVTVHDGAVDLWGIVSSEEEKKAARIAAEGVPGVQHINDYLTIPPLGSGML